jgi:tetratricopeptide (TPR) repeat protein
MVKKLDVPVQAVPNVVSLADQDLPANRLALEYAYRAASLADALEEAAVRLNLAALSIRLRNRTEAIRELERVLKVLDEGKVPAALTDAVGGTAQYLMGIAAEANGDLVKAEQAWRQAAQSRSTLLLDGGSSPIKEAAEQRLNQSAPRRQ